MNKNLNMRNLKNIILCLLLLQFIITGCKDWLVELPLNTVTEEQALITASDVEGAVAAGFAIFRRAVAGLTKEDTPATTRYGNWADHYFWGDYRSGDWITPNDDSDWQAIIENHLIRQSQLEPLSNWRLFYRVIEQCNLILDKITEIEGFTGDRKKILLAEIKFLRAMSHFYAARIWGDIPVNLKSRNVEPLGREPLRDVMEMVVNELEPCIADLPWKYGGSQKLSSSRGTKGAALALQAHALMWLEKYEAASLKLNEIIQSGQFYLAPVSEFRRLFDKGESDEIIFQLFYDNEFGEFADYYGSVMTWFLTNPYTDRGNLSVSVPKSKISEIFPDYAKDKSDVRVPEFFQSIDFSVSTNELRPIFEDPLQNGEREIMFAKFRKVKDRTYSKMDCPVILFRLAGLMLLKAEADARIGNSTEALENLNKIKERAGIPVFTKTEQEILIEEVMEESRRELLGESCRVFDLVRLGILHEFNEFITEGAEIQGAGFWPVSQEAFINNPNMTQTYYWQFNQ